MVSRNQQPVQQYLQRTPGDGMPSPTVQLVGIGRTFVTPAGRFEALRDINSSFAPGELIALVGKSGSGKSTLLNLMAGIDRPSCGQVLVAGTDISQLGEEELARHRGRSVGIVFQFFQLLPTLTALENVVIAMDLVGSISPTERRARGLELLERVGVSDQAHKLPATLSGGQQQRVAVARALANQPQILVADEPTGNLDSTTAEQIMQLFESVAMRGTTVVVATHDRTHAARFTRALTLADGALVKDSSSAAAEVRCFA